MARNKSKVIVDDSTTEVDTRYIPRSHQYELHLALKRFSVLICHRRFGKTVFALNHLIDSALRCQKPMPRYAYIAPTYGQAKRIAWDYMKMYTSMIPGVIYNEAELRVDFETNGARIQLLSAENPMALKGIYLDGCVLDEFGDMAPLVWREVVRPTLSDRSGWSLFIGTVKGTNHFWELHEYARDSGNEEWYTRLLKASETKIIPQKELDSAKLTMSEEEYMQEFECDPAAGLVGAYFQKELSWLRNEKRICSVPHDPTIRVDTYWDLGVNDAMAVWFIQSTKFDHRVIDYYEISGSDIPTMCKFLLTKKYTYGKLVLPHDAKVRDISTGKTRVQMFYSLGFKNIVVVPKVGTKMESINAARVALKKCYFDEKNCAQGLKCLSNYQKKWDAKNNVYQDHPLHNWASNGADAFQQFGLGNMEGSGSSDEDDSRFRDMDLQAETDYNPFRR